MQNETVKQSIMIIVTINSIPTTTAGMMAIVVLLLAPISFITSCGAIAHV